MASSEEDLAVILQRMKEQPENTREAIARGIPLRTEDNHP